MKYLFVFIVCCFSLFSCKKAEIQNTSISSIERFFDTIVKPYIDSAKIAGLSVEVMKGDSALMHKSYGYADLEFKTPMPENASFEIGSVTKQFTAAAILQQVESGKLALEDDITKYIKFNTQGHKVTVRHLLSHTSGIKGYTELPVFQKVAMFKYPKDTLLKLIEKEKFDFNPGEALIYNNTGFFMLGLILEKITGKSYEDYVKENLFDKAGMHHSYYCHENLIVPNQAHGYDMGDKGLEHAGYLDQTWPYAAGSLCSTAEDLCKWNEALHHNKILKLDSYKEFLTPAVLNNGSVTHYAKGITVTKDHGQTMIEHGGGINGFLSENRYYPKENLSIVVLINSTGPVRPGELADRLANHLLGDENKINGKFQGDLSKFPGTYTGRGRGEEIQIKIEKRDSTLILKKGDSTKSLIFIEGNTWRDAHDTYIFNDKSMYIDQVYGFLILQRK